MYNYIRVIYDAYIFCSKRCGIIAKELTIQLSPDNAEYAIIGHHTAFNSEQTQYHLIS